MAWDDSKDPDDLIRSSEWNTMVSDQKGRVVGTSVNEAIANTSANLPSASTVGRIFFETDTGRTLYDNGTSWVEIGLSESEISLGNLGSNSHSELSGITSDDHHIRPSAGTHLTEDASENFNVTEGSIDATNLDGSAGTSSQFLQTDGTNLSFANVPDEVVIQDTEPSSPFEGLWWYDTGSSTMQYYDGSNFKSVGISIDGSSITKNPQGEIQVKKPSEILIGDFEQTLDSWSSFASGDLSVNNHLTYDGNFGVTLNDYTLELHSEGSDSDTGTVGIKRDLDLTGINQIVFDGVGQTGSGSTANVTRGIDVNGTTVATVGNTNEIVEVTGNISGFSGVCTVEIYLEDNDTGDRAYFNVDNLRLVTTARSEVNL